MFLLELYVGKTGVLQGVGENTLLLRRVRLWGLSSGLLAALLVTAGYTQLLGISAILALFFNQTLAGLLLSLGYAVTLVFLARSPSWQRRFRPLSATGRMALTNYIVQSLICTILFYGFGYGFGLAGRVTPSTAMGVAVAMYGVQTLLRHVVAAAHPPEVAKVVCSATSLFGCEPCQLRLEQQPLSRLLCAAVSFTPCSDVSGVHL